MGRRASWAAVLGGVAVIAGPPVLAEDAPAWTWSLTVKAEAVGTRGASGVEANSTLASLDLLGYLDAERAWGWSGWRFHAHLLATTGGGTPPSEAAGDFQVASNIEAPEDIKLYEAWGERTTADGRWSLLAGLFDYNYEFARLDAAASFHNSSFGVPPDISQNGPTIFPTTALAARLQYRPSPALTARALVADGLPGSRRGRRGTHVEWRPDDGLFSTLEVEWRPARAAGAALRGGAWHTTAPGYDFADDRAERDNFGAYLSWESTLAAAFAGGGPLAGFAQFGHADPERNAVHRYVGGGLVWTRPAGRRDGEAIGLAVASAEVAAARRQREAGLAARETAIEVVYRRPLGPHLAVEPDVQFLDDPAGRPRAGDAWRFAVRLVLEY